MVMKTGAINERDCPSNVKRALFLPIWQENLFAWASAKRFFYFIEGTNFLRQTCYNFFKSFFLILALICILTVSFVACGDNVSSSNNCLTDASADDGYVLTLQFMQEDNVTVASTISVTKREIKDIYSTKPVVLDSFKASDKTDFHSVKGVYLDDILTSKNVLKKTTDFGGLQFVSTDNHAPKISKGDYDYQNGGSKINIALEYDGNVLTETGKSGALRTVLPNRANATWAKKLEKIVFSQREAVMPSPTKLYILQTLDNVSTLLTSKEFSKADNDNSSITHYFQGVGISALKDAGIVSYASTDEMAVMCWNYYDATVQANPDSYQFNGVTYYSYASFDSAAICMKTKTDLSADWTDVEKGPAFDGRNISNGLKRSYFSSLAIKNTAVINMEMSYRARIYKQTEALTLDKILEEVNMFDVAKKYKLTGINGEVLSFENGSDIRTTKVIKDGNAYKIKYDTTEFVLKTVEIVA